MPRTAESSPKSILKVVTIVLIMVPIALLHFVTGTHYQGPLPLFVNGYLIDILLPFGFYFLLCLFDTAVLKPWYVKGLLVFGAATAVEITQFFGFPLFGSTFDALDILAYGFGVLLAIIFDTQIFARIFPFWQPESDLT